MIHRCVLCKIVILLSAVCEYTRVMMLSACCLILLFFSFLWCSWRYIGAYFFVPRFASMNLWHVFLEFACWTFAHLHLTLIAVLVCLPATGFCRHLCTDPCSHVVATFALWPLWDWIFESWLGWRCCAPTSWHAHCSFPSSCAWTTSSRGPAGVLSTFCKAGAV